MSYQPMAQRQQRWAAGGVTKVGQAVPIVAGMLLLDRFEFRKNRESITFPEFPAIPG